MTPDPTRNPLLLLAALLAAALPTLLAWNVSPSPTFLNQALALGGWSALVLVMAATQPSQPGFAASRAAWPVQAALVLLALAALASGTLGALPASLTLSALGLLGIAALVVHAGAAARGADDGDAVFTAFAWAWLITGGINLGIGLVQVFAPTWPDGEWIAVSNIVGRAVGNLRQPNHLSSVLLWAAIAAVALLALGRIPRAAGALAFAAMIFGVVLTASRTGLVSVGILALWGLLDRRLPGPARALLLAAPGIYALAWFGMAQWAEWGHHTFGGAARLAETDVSGSRFGIWSNTLALIRAHPWTGVGWGEFNLAWSLSPFPGRPTAFFDHTHNLPLQFAVELGLPLATLVLALLLGALARLAWCAWRAEGDAAISRRAALMFVLMIGLHSLLEYPLWYAYFLLPAAWAFGFGLGTDARPPAAEGRRLLFPAAALAVALVSYAVWDYTRVTAIFSAEEGAPPLAQRIERGQRSLFFAHHADYAAATTEIDPRLRRHAFDSATHYLLDTRLMMAWADQLAAQGDVDRARHLAARLREFRNPASKDWFAVCEQPPAADVPRPFQCEPPQKAYGWRDFLPWR
jgi:O-antigen ligase